MAASSAQPSKAPSDIKQKDFTKVNKEYKESLDRDQAKRRQHNYFAHGRDAQIEPNIQNETILTTLSMLDPKMMSSLPELFSKLTDIKLETLQAREQKIQEINRTNDDLLKSIPGINNLIPQLRQDLVARITMLQEELYASLQIIRKAKELSSQINIKEAELNRLNQNKDLKKPSSEEDPVKLKIKNHQDKIFLFDDIRLFSKHENSNINTRLSELKNLFRHQNDLDISIDYHFNALDKHYAEKIEQERLSQLKIELEQLKKDFGKIQEAQSVLERPGEFAELKKINESFEEIINKWEYKEIIKDHKEISDFRSQIQSRSAQITNASHELDPNKQFLLQTANNLLKISNKYNEHLEQELKSKFSSIRLDEKNLKNIEAKVKTENTLELQVGKEKKFIDLRKLSGLTNLLPKYYHDLLEKHEKMNVMIKALDSTRDAAINLHHFLILFVLNEKSIGDWRDQPNWLQKKFSKPHGLEKFVEPVEKELNKVQLLQDELSQRREKEKKFAEERAKTEENILIAPATKTTTATAPANPKNPAK